MSVAVGAKAPDFTLPNQDREPVTLSEQLKKGPVVLAFMPAAFSGTCTIEMCAFRDSATELNKVNATVLGVTVDTFFALKAWGDAQTQAQEEARRRLGTDTAAVRRAVDDWTKANPQPKATLAQVADHIEHVRKIAGVDHVGIGSDFDGITDLVVGLEDVSKFPDLFAELSRRGWTDTDLRKLAGDNVLRALKQAEAVSARLKKQRPPSTKTIQQMDGKVAQ